MIEKALCWLNEETLDSELKDELLKASDSELEDAFYTDLSFGTGGMRGVIGAGTNRMNIYTLRRANYGYGKRLLKNYENPSVAIAYDSRFKSLEFAKDAACVLATLGVKVYLFSKITPTPELSFAVRYLHASGGIVITASHNPPKYNGYKIYDHNGCQYVPHLVDEVIEEINVAPSIFDIIPSSFEELKSKGMIEMLGDDVDLAYLAEVKNIAVNSDIDKKIKIVFTPLHGTSGYLATKLLTELGYDFVPVKEQMIPDPNFSTVESPNPENSSAFELGIKYAKDVKADIVIATDPDADRLGIAVLHNGDYVFLTGNQTGAILIDYLCKNRHMENSVLLNTIVTSSLGGLIANKYGIDVLSTLTGFKFIGEQIALLENVGKKVFFGYEESYGYIVKDFVRDKDSIQAILMICEVCNYYHLIGLDLVEVLENIFNEYGYYHEDTINITLTGATGAAKIDRIMDYFRNNDVDCFDVVRKEDYKLSVAYNKDGSKVELTLPKSNVIKFMLSDGSWFVLRPSGTEPKLKIYVCTVGKTDKESLDKVSSIRTKVMNIYEGIE